MFVSRRRRNLWLNAASAGGLAVAAALAAAPALAEVPNNNLNRNAAPTLAGANDVNGIGIIYTDYGAAGGGVCTGTLINPRMVLFAAHCVNTAAASSYGAASGGTPIAVGFKGDARAGLIAWLSSRSSSVANQTYNINQVFYNPLSLAEPLGNFYEADIAMGVLDAPTRGVPTWAMLFSPLTGTENLHVTIGGYGRSGTGTTGQSVAVDFRRRAGENMIGALASIDDVNLFLFGNGSQRGLGQNLYMVDFDDPARTNIYDFNIFGNDVALPNEGMTAQGDSGSALILDRAFSTPVIAGVLSLGTRYYSAQPQASYGTTAGYQPLYLYWDYIVANNPYKYVASAAGDADWFDASHWNQTIDPNYKIIVNGQLVTGTPTTPGAGVTGTGNEFGAICFRTDCASARDLARANESIGRSETADADAAQGSESTGGALIVSRDDLLAGLDDATISKVVASTGGESYAHVAETAPVAPIDAATAFTPPNNAAASTANGNRASYYDVTLAAAGRTGLNAAATIDRLTIGGSGAILDIGSAGSLTSLIDATITAGQFNVDGAFNTWEMLVMGGLVSGRGQINATALTSILGSIAPGGQASVGNLTLNGDLILTSGSRLFVDVSGATADKLVVRANAARGATGAASVGGLLNLNFLTAPTFGQTYTVLTAEGGVSGAFTAANDLSGVLYPFISYTSSAVNVSIAAESFTRFIDTGSSAQVGVGGLLDNARGFTGYAALKGVYDSVDTLEGVPLRGALESLAPYSAWSTGNLGMTQTETFQSVISGRVSAPRAGADAPQGLALLGNGVQIAALDATPFAATAVTAAQTERSRWMGEWKQGMAGFLAAGASSGEAGQLSGAIVAGQKEDVDSWYVAGGLERTVDHLTLGAAAGYSHGKAAYAGGLSDTEANQFQLSGYGSVRLGDTGYIGGHVGWSSLNFETERRVVLGGSTYRAEADFDGDVLFAGTEVGVRTGGGALKITPNFGLNAYRVSIDGYAETGSIVAMNVDGRDLKSLQGFFGVRVDGDASLGGLTVRPSIGVRAVAEMLDDTDSGVRAAFAATGGTPATFVGLSRDPSWGEVTGGVVIDNGGRTSLSLQAASMFARDDVDYQTYRATVSIRF